MLAVNNFLNIDGPVYFGSICLVFRYVGSFKDDVSAEMGHKSQARKNLKSALRSSIHHERAGAKQLEHLFLRDLNRFTFKFLLFVHLRQLL